ncbi:hypothetical protein ACNFH8_25570 [Pseudomonas sp. NY15436]|uniref:hypothetical protein n=1 Tax=Pseudomonas sp. NY15436 TaxID=3400359 RepID=UPI003A858625
MPSEEMKLDLIDRPDGTATLWTATNNKDRSIECEVITERNTRVIAILPPGGFIQIITSNKEDANVICREITGKGAH